MGRREGKAGRKHARDGLLFCSERPMGYYGGSGKQGKFKKSALFCCLFHEVSDDPEGFRQENYRRLIGLLVRCVCVCVFYFRLGGGGGGRAANCFGRFARRADERTKN